MSVLVAHSQRLYVMVMAILDKGHKSNDGATGA